jgi:DNA primase
VELPSGEDPDSFIRKNGAEAFAGLIADAKDFFDFEIDRFAASPEFATASGKTQFAKKMAAWVSLITDTTLRQTVANKIAGRLEISSSTFVKLLKQSSRVEAGVVAGASQLQYEPMISNLIHVALTSAEACEWLRGCDWQRVLTKEPDTELLIKFLLRGLIPGDTAGINSWLSTLEPAEESTIRRILEKGMLPLGEPSRNDAVAARPETVSGVLWHPLKTAQDAWLCIERRQIQRRIDAITARIRTPPVPPFDEIIILQKEVLDLKNQLNYIARPFSSSAV